MKTVKDLDEMRDRLKQESESDSKPTKVLVGMATCGIAAGAKPIFDALAEELSQREINNVEIKQTGCIGVCQFEPVVEVYAPGQEKVTYVNMSVEKAKQIVEEHLVAGQPVVRYTIGALEQ